MLNSIPKCITIFILPLVLIFSAITLSSTRAAEFDWRFQNNWVETRWESKMLNEFAERVHEKSNGRLKIAVFSGGSLGIKPADHLQALRSGAVQMAVLYPGYLARDVPEVANALPNGAVYSDSEAVALNPVLMDIYRKGYERWNAVTVGWLNTPPYRLSIFCNEPIRSLAGLSGKKLRVWVKDVIEPFNALGIRAQLMPQDELYVAIQTGVVDCAIHSLAIASTLSLQEVTNYAAPMFTLSGLSAVAVSKRHWESLPADLQAVVNEAGEWLYAKTETAGLEVSRDLETKAVETFNETGEIKVLDDFSTEDKNAFYNEVVKTWLENTSKAGDEQVANRNNIMTSLKEIRARIN
ncbi:TRAP transporter substrate-binding protein [Oceanibacterium hippocampi]|uniref:Lactate-binding periplasmic protein n=1 Tax=Oceanibacterium hippocampi TaxID=745714 RepID=A0A1Y5U2F2_9PROT|nr:TRAP transporter substrate-binding protein DctP [Oceanibacterium hippocampi]SLN75542.1 Lactate-binding periplasmic protein precursor [Oceanibacterium hippocampi]